MLPDEALESLWLAAVALYDNSANPSPEFASVAAVRSALRASPLVDAASFDVVVVAVAGRSMHERGDKTLLDYEQARPATAQAGTAPPLAPLRSGAHALRRSSWTSWRR